MFEVGVVTSFRATHRLIGDFGAASQQHAHDYRIEASVQGDHLQSDGTLFDITLLQRALAVVVQELAGAELNDLPGLAFPNPSAEVLARYLVERVAPGVAGHDLRGLQVRVWESPEAYASYAAPLT